MCRLLPNDLSSVSDAKHSSTKPNNIPGSEVSECQGQAQQNPHKNDEECQEEPTKNVSQENSEDYDSEYQGDTLSKGQFGVPIVGLFSLFEKYPHSDNCVCLGCGYDKLGRRYQNNQ
jgi:hypothetical protein